MRKGKRMSVKFWSYATAALAGLLLLTGCAELPALHVGGIQVGSSSVPAADATAFPSVTAVVLLTSTGWCAHTSLLSFNVYPAASPTATGTASATTSGSTPVPAVSSTVVTDWSTIQSQLGFSLYLPAALPSGTCLMSVFGTINAPTIPNTVTIGFLLPGAVPLSFSENLYSLQKSVSTSCTTGPMTMPVTLTASLSTPVTENASSCIGLQGNTSIVLEEAAGKASAQALFTLLQSDHTWVLPPLPAK